MKHSTPTLSVVIPCYNEENYVGELLKDIGKQTVQPKEVILADSRSMDGTVMVAKRFQKQLRLKIATSQIRSPGAARNTGAELASSDYVVFIDADMRLPVTAFEQTLCATDEAKIDYITPLFSTSGRHPVDQLAIKMINFDIRYGVTAKSHLPGIGGYMCVRRTLHETLKGFKTQGRGEDMDYLARMRHRAASHTVLKSLVVEASNRRLAKDGRLVSALHFIPQRWRVNNYVIRPALKKLGREKQFGEF